MGRRQKSGIRQLAKKNPRTQPDKRRKRRSAINIKWETHIDTANYEREKYEM